jgi:hypothetical protein
MTFYAIPKGIRNKNPLNIRFKKANNWDGQIGESGGFSVFEETKFGIRAAAKLLRNYQFKYQLDTIQKIINRWAPPVENVTSSYIEHVAQVMEMSPAEYINLNDDGTLVALINVMILHENGVNPYSKETILEGVELV